MIDLNQFTVATEIFPTHIRNQVSAVAIIGFFLADIHWLNLLPTATATIGWKYYLVFVSLAVVHTTYLFFALPEVCQDPMTERTIWKADINNSYRQVVGIWRRWTTRWVMSLYLQRNGPMKVKKLNNLNGKRPLAMRRFLTMTLWLEK